MKIDNVRSSKRNIRYSWIWWKRSIRLYFNEVNRVQYISLKLTWDTDWGFDFGFFMLSTAIGLLVVALIVYWAMFNILGYPNTDIHNYIYGLLILLFAISIAIGMGSKENVQNIAFHGTLLSIIGFIIYTIILGVQI